MRSTGFNPLQILHLQGGQNVGSSGPPPPPPPDPDFQWGPAGPFFQNNDGTGPSANGDPVEYWAPALGSIPATDVSPGDPPTLVVSGGQNQVTWDNGGDPLTAGTPYLALPYTVLMLFLPDNLADTNSFDTLMLTNADSASDTFGLQVTSSSLSGAVPAEGFTLEGAPLTVLTATPPSLGVITSIGQVAQGVSSTGLLTSGSLLHGGYHRPPAIRRRISVRSLSSGGRWHGDTNI